MPAALEKRDGVNHVAVTGLATVSSAVQIRDVLLDALASTGDVELTIQDLERADMSFIQLLVSLDTSLREAGRAFRVDGNIEPLRSASGGSHSLDAFLEND